MVHDSAEIRQRGAHDFHMYYDCACARQESVPLPAVTVNLERGMLDFNGDRIKLSDWPPILNSITINKHLHHIAISSTCQSNAGDAERRFFKSSLKRKIPVIRSKDLTFKLSKALRDCLTVSTNLKTLQLNGLPLRERDLIVLTKGFAKSVSLENLSMANCPISDEGLEIICQSVKYSTCIRTVDFTGCNLTWRGAEHMASIIKHQGMQRHGTAWAESLRYRQPHFERMSGLRRVTLNCNTLIGDRGAAALANELSEDLWVKAVDLQRCGLSNEGARRLLETLKTNSTLSVLDVRSNPLIDKVLIKTIIEKVLMNADGESPEYCWIKPAAVEIQRATGPKRRTVASFRGKNSLRIASRKGVSSAVGSGLQSNPCSRSCIPWRTAARAGRQRGLPPGATAINQSFQGATTVKVTIETDSEEDDDDEEEVMKVEQRASSSSAAHEKITDRQYKRVQMELRECRLMLSEERTARLRAESRLKELDLEIARLRTSHLSQTSVLEEEAVLESIENSFKKFHSFVDLLKDAGLGQLVSAAGFDKSDFESIGKPQLSSTTRPCVDDAAVNQRVNQNGGATVKAPPPSPQPAVMPSSLGFVQSERPLEVTFPPVYMDVPGGANDVQYLKPVYDSGSDLSQKSLRKTFQNQLSRSQSPHSPSHHSNDHQYSSFNNSDDSHSSGSHGRLSSRSSLSDRGEERRGGDKERRGGGKDARMQLGADGRPGSGASSGSEYGEILGKVTSIRTLGAQARNVFL